jgi:rRNA maturation endonuclease Nob1
MKTKTQWELEIEFNRKRRIKRLELQLKMQKDLGNLSRADILKSKIEKLKNK